MQFIEYVKLQKPEYEILRHHEAIAKHLTAIESGEINRFIILEPPRHGKSSFIGKFFCSWYMDKHKSKRVIGSSYSPEIANDAGRIVLNMINEYNLSSNSPRRYFAVGAGATCDSSADMLLVDDPIKTLFWKVRDIDQYLANINQWFMNTAYTCLIERSSPIVITMSRWHKNDLAGYLMREQSQENWTVLTLPAIAEENDDIARNPGEALCPEYYPIKHLEKIKSGFGLDNFNALYQQRPAK